MTPRIVAGERGKTSLPVLRDKNTIRRKNIALYGRAMQSNDNFLNSCYPDLEKTRNSRVRNKCRSFACHIRFVIIGMLSLYACGENKKSL